MGRGTVVGDVAQVAAKAVEVVVSPVTAVYKPVAEAVADAVKPGTSDKINATIDNTPVVGTIAQGYEAGGRLSENVATALTTGNTKPLVGDYISSAKGAAVVGAGVYTAGAGYVGSKIADDVLKNGIDVGSLYGYVGGYFGNTLKEQTGIDLNKFFPSPGSGAVDYNKGAGSFLSSKPTLDGPELPGISNTTIVLSGVAILVFVLVIKKR